MQDILLYIIIFSIIIIFSWIYLGKKKEKKEFSLGKKYYSFGTVDIHILKEGSSIQSIIIKFEAKECKSDFIKAYLEIINSDKERTIIRKSLVEIFNNNYVIEKNQLSINFDILKNYLKENEIEKQNFRFSLECNNSKKLKSVILALNKRWSIYAADTGKYN